MKLKNIVSIEGNTQLLDGGAMFGNAPKEMWQSWVKADEKNRISLACRCLLLTLNNGQNILFEAGIGAFFEPKLKERFGVVEKEHMLLKNLEKIGIKEDDIHGVVLSHLHFDHAGGLLSAFNGEKPSDLLFPHAKIYVGKEHWQRALQPHSRDKASFIPYLNDLLLKSERLVLIEKEGESPFSSNVKFIFSQGHTVGLMLSEISIDEGVVVFTSDLIPGAPWVHVPISMGYDRFPELVIDEKKQLLTRLIENNSYLFFTHDTHVALGKLCQDEKGKFYTNAIEV